MTNDSSSGEKSNTEGHEPPQDAEPTTDEYPSGFSLLFIVLAIILGIFLASLDMVSRLASCPYLKKHIANPVSRRQSSRPQSPKSPTNSAASTSYRGTAPRSS